MEFGKARFHQLEAAEYISLFGYSLSRPENTDQRVYELKPPRAEFEYSLRLGFLRAELGRAKIPLDVSRRDDVPSFSLMSIAEALSKRRRDKLYEIKEELPGARRFRLMLPASPSLFKEIAGTEFYEDVAYYDELGRDFMIPVTREGEDEIKLCEGLDLKTFHRMWRQLQFISLLDVFGLKYYAKQDQAVLLNSLIRVMHETEALDILSLAGVTKKQARDFLNLVAADVHHLGYFDIQYQPVHTHRHTDRASNWGLLPSLKSFMCPGWFTFQMFCAMCNSQIGYASNQAPWFLWKGLVKHLKVGLRGSLSIGLFSLEQIKTDVDVAILEANKLYILECRVLHFPPTDPHEMRDLWEEIEQGVLQLERAKQILIDAKKRQSYLTNWFPGVTERYTSDVEVVPCVLTSHRIFSGMHHKGIPIRDFSALALMLDNGIVGFGSMDENGHSFMYQHRIVNEKGFCAEDLDDFLSNDSRYFRIYSASSRPFWKLEKFGNVTLARDTYMHDFDSDEWLANMEKLGYERLPDKQEKVTFPMSVEELLSAADKESDASENM